MKNEIVNIYSREQGLSVNTNRIVKNLNFTGMLMECRWLNVNVDRYSGKHYENNFKNKYCVLGNN